MATLPTLPGAADRAVQMPANVLDPNYYLFLRLLLKALADRDAEIVTLTADIAAMTANIETLRVALNEVRADPTSIYPAVPAF